MVSEEAIKGIIKESIYQYELERKKKTKAKLLHNTRLLMQNYNTLVDHIEHVNEDLEEVELKFKDLNNKDILLISAKRCKAKTTLMLTYLESALTLLERQYWELGEKHKYRAFEMYYLDKKQDEEIAKVLKCGINSPRRWREEIISKLSVLLWGEEALDFII